MKTQNAAPDAYWSLPAAELLDIVNSSSLGLSSEKAEQRRALYGPNALGRGERSSAVRIFLRQVSSPIVLMLIAAAGLALIVRSWSDALIILVMVFGSALLGFSQEFRAAVSMERLRAQIQPTARVVRSGVESEVASESIVPGDIVVLAAGDRIPADGVLLESRDLFVVQAALTGESMPAEKSPAPVSPTAGLARRTNCVFMGSSVRSGSGRALVVRTGGATEFGKIAHSLRRSEPETDFERGIRRYGVMLSQIMLLLMLAVFTANVFLDRPRIDALLFAIALGVGLSPELLPAIVTITLSQGARRLADGGAITRKLAAIENLGGVNVLCTDKTGTLTKGEMALEEAIDPYGAASDEVLRLGFINAALQAGIRNPLDEALRASGAQRGLDAGKYKKLDEIPYDFSRRRLSVAVADSGGAVLITKGAFANILEICAHIAGGEGPVPIDDASAADLKKRHERLSRQGHRVLALATKPIEGGGLVDRSDEAAMTFAGFLVFSDPVKTDIREVIEGVRALGVEVKIISGDNRFVAAHVANEIGLDGDSLKVGEELQALRDDALARVASEAAIFAEIEPGQKERIIRALKSAGHVVGYMGDGINDAPALQAADVGVSVDQAVDVARDAADLVLLRQDLGILLRGVIEGRRTFANTLKYISITTSANVGNMISMAAASLFLPFLPLLAKQILLNNLLSDAPVMAIAGDSVDKELTARPLRWNVKSIARFSMLFGLISSVFDFLVFAVLLIGFHAGPGLFRTGWFLESLLTELAIALVIRTRRPFFRSKPGSVLLVATVAVAAAAYAIPHFPAADMLGFVPLPWTIVVALTALTGVYIFANEMAKRRFNWEDSFLRAGVGAPARMRRGDVAGDRRSKPAAGGRSLPPD